MTAGKLRQLFAVPQIANSLFWANYLIAALFEIVRRETNLWRRKAQIMRPVRPLPALQCTTATFSGCSSSHLGMTK